MTVSQAIVLQAKNVGELTAQYQKLQDAAQAQQFLGQSLFDAARGATSLSDAFRKLAGSIADAVEQALLLGQGPLAGIFGTAGGGNSGGLLGSLFSGLFGFLGGGTGAAAATGAPIAIASLFSAKGNVFANDNLVPFARGGIIDHPALFRFAKGTGLMGEAGPEAIMPLKRGPDGSLGVQMHGGSGRGGINVQVDIDGSGMSDDELAASAGRLVETKIKQAFATLPDKVAAINRNGRRR
jgi:phage-related minor tail protein